MNKTVTENSTISLDITISDENNNIIESTIQKEPIIVNLAQDSILPGLKQHILGRKKGDSEKLLLTPQEAYGDYHSDLKVTVKKDALHGISHFELGMMLQAESTEGNSGTLKVTGITETEVTLDANHPFAGKNIIVDYTILNIEQD